MDNKIRIHLDVIHLDVNDDGDIIDLPVSDEQFNNRLMKFADSLQERAKVYNGVDETDIIGIIQSNTTFHEGVREEFDKLFGARSYEKVFGKDILVGAEYVLEFINACLPHIFEHQKNRVDKLSKYSPDRTGSAY